MFRVWKKRSREEISAIVSDGLNGDVNYRKQFVLGIPASYLDRKVFTQDPAFMKNAPFISAFIQNPNHIGCHTFGESLSYFKGTQEIEKELIEICAVDILGGEPSQQDGYVAAGGTEANIQAVWIFRNYFIQELDAKNEDICLICSEDSHYSVDKAANVLVVDIFKTKVDEETREITHEEVKKTILEAKEKGKKHFIIIANMMTTLFGSVDNINIFVEVLEELEVSFKIHIDGAFGGFYYPFSEDESDMTFKNPHITSFTLDAHKMAQAPYGTGMFIIRKGYMHYANTKQASYIKGEDCTLSGSRSGANAIAAWMILVKTGPYGWREKIFILQQRSDWMCEQLDILGVEYYRHPKSNNITLKANSFPLEVANRFGLMPDNHYEPKWYKIVIMSHVTVEKLLSLVEVLKEVKRKKEVIG